MGLAIHVVPTYIQILRENLVSYRHVTNSSKYWMTRTNVSSVKIIRIQRNQDLIACRTNANKKQSSYRYLANVSNVPSTNTQQQMVKAV